MSRQGYIHTIYENPGMTWSEPIWSYQQVPDVWWNFCEYITIFMMRMVGDDAVSNGRYIYIRAWMLFISGDVRTVRTVLASRGHIAHCYQYKSPLKNFVMEDHTVQFLDYFPSISFLWEGKHIGGWIQRRTLSRDQYQSSCQTRRR